ncbi:cell division protein FtsL [Pseudoprimorskyibacter insulae]|uniref:Cell division protein FtsL n=1 Tax=Pseudoprimorskyibacter insulae TaxID=1695997 RepID=A0A2R8ARB4_9RHOB|nr:cell division protein FtsL [Pseudoprimorskyibacter insulae]SPF78379.1 hypothetical protein PRI8871_00979 [Pseudoprimorskyibacter insulae]
MRFLIYGLTFLSMIGFGFWAYRENYETQAALSEVGRLQSDIGAARERLGVLRAEWAYLNRPDRLRELANLNYDRLQLMPFSSDQFGRIDQIAYPQMTQVTEELEFEGTVELSSNGGQEP